MKDRNKARHAALPPGLSRRLGGIVICAATALSAGAAYAQTLIFQENFDGGLGQFTASGYVSQGSNGAVLRGSLFGADGSITSAPISTVGFNNVVLSYDRATTGLDYGDFAAVSYSIDGINYTPIESVASAAGRATFTLPAAAADQSQLRLRFRIQSNSYYESFAVDSIRLEGGTGGTTDPTTNPLQRGPAPSTALLEADRGPFAVATTRVSSPIGYGGGTIYYPTATSEGPFAVIAVSPGYTAMQNSISWWGPRLASNGFVVITIDTISTFDQPASRANQLMSALNQVVNLSKDLNSPIYRKADGSRLGVMGHSMGGGGALIAARNNPELKAAVPLAPWSTGVNFYTNAVPTLVVACESDTVAPVDRHASSFYNGFAPSLKKAYLEINNGSHMCPLTGNSNPGLLGKYGVAWMKRFMDNDTRYAPFLCGAPHQADLTRSAISEYRENCPY